MNDEAKDRFCTLIGRYSEDSYFYLAKNYLGAISTPFHKQAVTTRLCSFFSQDHIQDRMIDLLDGDDVLILSLLAVSGPITSEQAIHLLTDKGSYGDWFCKISNLQERLILLDDEGKLFFNPLIEDRLRALTSLKPLLGTEEEGVRQGPYCSTEFLRAYFSLVAKEERHAYRGEYAHLFPEFEAEHLERLFEQAGAMLLDLGVLYPDGRKTCIDYDLATSLLALDNRHLAIFCLSYGLASKDKAACSRFSAALLDILAALGSCDTQSLKLIVRLLALREGVAYDSTIMDSLAGWGIVTLEGTWHANDLETPMRTRLLIDTDNTVGYSGSCPEDDMLYRFADLQIMDRQTRYRVSPKTLCRAFDSGLDHRRIVDYIKKEADGTMSRLLLQMIEMTYEQYNLLSIHDGIVLQASGRTKRLIDQLESLREHRTGTLGEGIYLMRRSTEAQWRRILESAGMLVPATNRTEQVTIVERKTSVRFSTLLEAARAGYGPSPIRTRTDRKQSIDTEHIPEAIEQAHLSKPQVRDITQRYELRMILDKSQIVGQVINGVIEAGGFDYQGKLGLCRQATGKKDIALQLQLTDRELIVQALEVAYTPQKEALLKAAVFPRMEVKIIPISKIFLVRQVRYHLY